MKSAAYPALALLALFATSRPFAEPAESKVTGRTVSVVGFLDAGQIIKGTLVKDDGTDPKSQEGLFLNRNGIALTYSGTMNENLEMNIGVGGLFWKPIPELSAQSRHIQFGPGISEASAQYNFSPKLNLKFGYFGYDYNPDAKNLGEYLLRSEAYPSIIHTAGPGGWVWMNDNKYKSMGAKFTWNALDGALRQDFLFFSEFWEAPVFDFSPSYVATMQIGKAFEVGAGFSLHRWLPIKPSVTTPHDQYNTYVEVDNFPAFPAMHDDSVLFVHQLAFNGGTLKAMESQVGKYIGSDSTAIATSMKDSQGHTVWVLANGDTLRAKKSEALTFKAVKVMARASLNLAALMDMSEKNSGPFKLFAEVAVLGVQNQPYFYEKIQNRIPVMAGVDLPTFGILNLLCAQMEYFNNPLPDNNSQQFSLSRPQPSYPGDNPADYEYQRAAGVYGRDDFKWSVFLQKSLIPGLDLFAQAANDHFRVQDGNAQPSFMPVTRGKSDWYYLLRLQWGM